MRIKVYNVGDREVVTYHIILLLGEIDDCLDDGVLDVWNSNDMSRRRYQWPVVEGCFKVLMELKLGENILSVQFEDEVLTLSLIFEEPKFAHFVRPVYIVLSDDDGYFQGPDDEDCSPTSAIRRITLGAQLIQTFTAEKMKEHGFGRQTFQLETGDDYAPLCHLFRSKLTTEQAYAMSGNDLWSHFAKELMTSHLRNKDKCKWYCFMSFTRYQPPSDTDIPKTHSEILRYTKGHTALGGGGLALFGTGNLHTWAESLDEVYARLTDCRKINRRKYMDDSAYREYYWANYATGLGASLHELGHTFDLAHTPSGIMARGFDDLHKVFTIQRLRSNGRCNSGRQRYNSNSSSISRTPSSSSIEGSPLSMSLDANQRRYKDVCYGSPYKRISRSSSSNSIYIAPPPLVVKVETGFKPVKSPSMLTFSVKNYDGSETHRTIAQDPGGETVTELNVATDGKLLSGNATRRDKLSLGFGIKCCYSSSERRPSSCSSVGSSASLSPSSSTPSTLPNSPEEPDLRLPDVQFADDGAHWYRSSAVVLRFHRWFNKAKTDDPRKNPVLSNKCHILSASGLRLVELRTDPGGLVFHHWEFLHETPPLDFTLKRSRIKAIPEGTTTATVMAEDTFGNILKKRVKIDDFE
ncbi:uncharacterized protein [Haliotis asinina]|uniref:uncharacterized protein isoform X1 n=1 Tax=Haliotis asinina TaxID=109174 RepID=UPI003531F698